MATTGELKWAGFTARYVNWPNLVNLRGDFAYFEFWWDKWDHYCSPIVPVKDLDVSKYDHSNHHGRKCKITVYLIRYHQAYKPFVKVLQVPWASLNMARRKPVFTPRQAKKILSLAFNAWIRPLSKRRIRQRYQWTSYRGSPSVSPNPLELLRPRIYGKERSDTPYAEFVVSTQTYYRAFTSVRTPGFRTMKRRQLPVNPFHCRIAWTDNNAVWYKISQSSLNNFGKSGYFWEGAYNIPPALVFGYVGSTPVHSALATSKSIEKLISNAQLDLNANLAQDMVQMHQTLYTIADTARRIGESVHMLRSGNLQGAKHALLLDSRHSLYAPKTSYALRAEALLQQQAGYRARMPRKMVPSNTKTLAENWLALQYGWKPLLQDVDGTMRTLANLIQQSSVTRTIASSGQDTVRTNRNIVWSSSPVGVEDTISTTQVKFKLTYGLASKLVSFLAQTGFTNPLNLAWEILPYSFVVDWFLPIGPYLSTLSAWDGMVFLKGSKTQFTKMDTFVKFSYAGPYVSSPGYFLATGGGYHQQNVLVDRVALTGFPTSQPPSLKNPFSATHALNALALMKSAFRLPYR